MRFTKNIYSLPLPAKTYISKIVTDGPGHVGPYRGAVDLAVEDGTDVLAPLEGRIITVVDNHDKYGAGPEYAKFVNYIQIIHENGETSDLMHLGRGSVTVKRGDRVKRGQKIAKTGLSGYMTAPHLHWFVFVKDNSQNGFCGLRIRTIGKDELYFLAS